MENTKITPEINKGKIVQLLPFLTALAGAVILVLAFFLPYSSAEKEYKKYLKEYSDSMYAEEINMTNEDVVGISMLEYARMYAVAAKIGTFKEQRFIGIICVVLISMIGVFSLLTLLSAALKKPIALIIFNGINFGVFRMLSWDLKDRGVVPNSSYIWGISYYLYQICAVIILIGAIWLLVTKIRMKRRGNGMSLTNAI